MVRRGNGGNTVALLIVLRIIVLRWWLLPMIVSAVHGLGYDRSWSLVDPMTREYDRACRIPVVSREHGETK